MPGRVAVLGAGAWGTALARVAARPGQPVALWGRDVVRMRGMGEARENQRHLPGVRLDAAITPTSDLAAAVRGADLVLAAVPAQALGGVLIDVAAHLEPGVPVVVCAKGIERSTGRFLSDVVGVLLPGHPPAVLSGPSFAADVGRGLPTAVTIAAESLAMAARLGGRLGSASFRLYHTDDLRGVEIGGAAKNVMAIACGIAHGSGFGASAVAALTARGFAELVRFGAALGARPETLAGLSGLGDLVLTCGSIQSRNFALGEAIGRSGVYHPDPGGPVIEGVWTASVLVHLAAEQGVDMPISASVAAVIEGRLKVAAAIEALLARPFRSEQGE